MTALLNARGIDSLRKNWLCRECGERSPVVETECGSCSSPRRSPGLEQSFALNNQGNGSVVNNVLVVGGNMDSGDDVYHLPRSPGPEHVFEPQPVSWIPPRELSTGERALIAGSNVAIWASVFVLVPAAFFIMFVLVAGLAQVSRVVPH